MASAKIIYSEPERRQRFWARLAGFLFFWLILAGITGALTESHIAGSGSFAETAQRIKAAEHLYRLGICMELIETMSALLLAFALYVTLRPVDPLLALFGMFWRAGESILGSAGVMLAFLRVQAYTSATVATAGQSAALADVLGHGGSSVDAIFFSVGSLIFFYLFFKSRYIPRSLSGFGMFASVLVTLLCFGSLIFPEHASALQYGWIPMAVAEVATGIWLMLFAVQPRPVELLPSV